MIFALKLAKSGGSQLANAAVIVDPSADQIIASACDEFSSWPICLDDNGTQSLEPDEPSTSHGFPNGSSLYKSNANGAANDSNTSYRGVSCMNPWQWSEQQKPSSNSCLWHPLRHAAMVAIEHSAARDRRLFPTTWRFDEKSVEDVPMENCVVGSPAKKQRRSPNNVNSSEETPMNDFPSKSDRPYLCTGYDVYVAWEPCAMCAMALLHQRVRRIFYAFPNPSTGALGSVYRLQGEKSLNHHYAVFRVVLHDEPLGNAEELTTVTVTNDL
ncbi:hypothetical protein RND81_01G181400 [Saponaria officinalis]